MNIWDLFVNGLESVVLALYDWSGSAGLAIILFTLVARLAILPFTVMSMQSMRKMQELQPQIKEIQRKYGKDQQKLNEETMKLYRDYKVNPAGGCLPMLLQFPIFIGVYQAVLNLTRVTPAEHAASQMIQVMANAGLNVAALPQSLTEPRLAGGFLWLPNLGQPDPFYILGVLMIAFQLVVQLMSTPRVQDAQQKAMTQTMLFMPLVFGYMGFTFPSGAVLYWVIGSIISMIQQYVITGWGSLANYLTFLPPDAGLFPPVNPATATAGVASGAVSQEPAQKMGFWDVLQPLMDEQGSEKTAPGDQASEQAISDVRRQIGQGSPRRRRARR